MAEIAGSNRSEAMDIRPLCLLCLVNIGTSATGDNSFREVLPCVCVCVCVCVYLILCDLEATTMLRPGPEFGWLHNRK
jgi:hypothetical protein